MILAAIIISALIIFAVAQVAVGAAVSRSMTTPAQIIFDVHEAIEFCAQALPEATTAELSYDDLRRLLRLHLEWIQAYHWSPENSSASPILLFSEEPLEYIQQRCDVIGLDVSTEDIRRVCEAHYEYLKGIGALHTQSREVSESDLAKPLQVGIEPSVNPEISTSI